MNMQYNFACALITDLHEFEAALDPLGPVLEKVRMVSVNWMKIDPDLDLIRDDPRFKAMPATAEVRRAKSS